MKFRCWMVVKYVGCCEMWFDTFFFLFFLFTLACIKLKVIIKTFRHLTKIAMLVLFWTLFKGNIFFFQFAWLWHHFFGWVLKQLVLIIKMVLCFSESGSSGEAVQQSQVSSSKPSIVGTDILGSLLLEVGAFPQTTAFGLCITLFLWKQCCCAIHYCQTVLK